MNKREGNKRRVAASKKKAEVVSSGHSWFLGIGINTYADKHFSDLKNAVADVEAMAALLQERYDVTKVKLLLDKEATREHIIMELDRLEQEVQAADKLIIFYAGHGHVSKANKGFWIPHDAKHTHSSQYLRNSTIRDYLESIASKHTLLIADSCFSGALFTRGKARSSAAIDKLEQKVSRWALCSGRHDELVDDGRGGGHSPFTSSILNILRENTAPKLNVGKVIDQVMELTMAKVEDQTPEGNPLRGVGHKGGQYVFRLKADEAADWAECEREGSVASYRAFLLKYPEGLNAEPARAQLAFMEEEAWQKASRQHTVLAYSLYEEQYPQGRYQEQSLAAIKEVEEEQSWSEAKQRHRLSAYKEYLREYPQGKYQAQAKQSIQAFMAKEQESHLWQQCLRSERKEDFEAYLSQYPAGRYVEEARRRLSDKDRSIRKVEESEDDKFLDPRDHSEYMLVNWNGEIWLKDNFRFQTSKGSWTIVIQGQQRSDLGCYYDWQAAKAACPEGWRLPNHEECIALLGHFGGYRDWTRNPSEIGDVRAFFRYFSSYAKEPLDFSLVGYYDPKETEVKRRGKVKAFWSATENESNPEEAWCCVFDYEKGELQYLSIDKRFGLCCHYVKDK